MSTVETIIRLVLAAILGGYLYYRHWQRVQQLVEPTDKRDWTGTGFDPSAITPKIEKVRQDYLAEKHPPESHFRRGLMAFARQTVGHLAFFQDRSHTGESGPGEQRH
jgi:hypothetical protein